MTRPFRVLLAAACCLAAAQAQSSEPTLAEVLQRTFAYVERFHAAFASMIADEEYEQVLVRNAAMMPDRYGIRTPVRRRSLRSEFVLVFIPKTRTWIGFRDVVSVDGRPVKDRAERLARLLIRGNRPTDAELETLANESARFNIGDIRRNTNQPLLVLIFFDAGNRSRFTYERAGGQRIDGVRTWGIRYREHASPTIVRTAEERDLYSEGTVWVDPATGRILRARHQLEDVTADLRTTMEVRFRPDPRFDVNVPVEMTEEYAHIVPRLGLSTRCRARYTNFRRFEVESKLIVPK